jgi:uncharacterized protein involved in exopolysaccharide biosynthesis
MSHETQDGPEPQPRNASVLGVAMAHRWTLLVVFLALAAAGYCGALFLRPAYRAEAIVMSVHPTPQGLLGSLVGATALSAVSMPQQIDQNEPIALIQSYSLLTKFLSEDDVIQKLCDAHAIKCSFRGINPALVHERTIDSAVTLFQKHLLSVEEDKLTGLVHVSVIWYDRNLAAAWCNDLIQLTNRVIQDRAEATAATRVRFLEEQYTKTSLIPLQSAISSVLESELTKQMDAATQPEFAWRVIDRAWPPDDRYPARPLKAVIAAASGVGGALICLLLLLWRELAIRRSRESASKNPLRVTSP